MTFPLPSVPRPATAKPAPHSFLMESGRWKLEGHWLLNREEILVPIHGRLIVAWNAETWFNLVGKICLPASSETPVPFQEATLQYRGHFDPGHLGGSEHYSFMLQHSYLGKVEGEGRVLPNSIMQRFWILGDRENRTGVDHFCRIDSDHYHWSSSLLNSHTLVSTMEAQLERQR